MLVVNSLIIKKMRALIVIFANISEREREREREREM